MILTGIQDGSWTSLLGVEFGNAGASAVDVKVLGSGKGSIRICLDTPSSDEAIVVPVSVDSKEPVVVHYDLDGKITGKHNVFFVFEGEGYQVYSWEFTR